MTWPIYDCEDFRSYSTAHELLTELRRLRAENATMANILSEARQYVAFAYNEGMDGAESVGLAIDAAMQNQ